MTERLAGLSPAKKRKVYIVCLALLLLLTGFLRIYRIDKVPEGIHYDEAALSYNAWCIQSFGTDGYGNRLPLCPQNLFGSQASFYTYLTAGMYRLFGRSVVTLRLPMAVLGVLLTLFGMLILKEAFGRKLSLIGGVLLSICPYFIMHFRFGFDCNAFLALFTVAFYLLIRAVKSGKPGAYALAGVLTGLCLYTYGLSYIILPVFLVTAAAYLLYTGWTNWKRLLAFALPVFVLAIPHILFVAVNVLDMPAIVTPVLTINKVPRATGSELSLRHFSENLQAVCNCVLFCDSYKANAIEGFYTLYAVSVPFFLVGVVRGGGELVRSLQRKRYGVTSLVCLWFGAVFLLGLMIAGYGPSIHRLNGIFFPALYFTCLGLLTCYRILLRRGWKLAFAGIVALLYLVSFVRFLDTYRNFSLDVTYETKENSVSDYAAAYRDLEAHGVRAELWIDEEPIFYYALHDTLEPACYANDTIAISNARFRAFEYEPGYTEIQPEGAVYVMREVNKTGIDWFEASPAAGNYERVEYGAYRMYVVKGTLNKN